MRKFSVYLVISLILIGLNVTPVVREARGYVAFLLNPLSFTLLTVGSEVSNYTSTISKVRQISIENQQLKENLFTTQSALVSIYNDKNEKDFEQAQKKFINSKGKIITSEVVGKRLEQDFTILEINKGLESGIKVNDSVFYNGYLVGQVLASFPYKSDVKVIAYSTVEVPAKTSNNETSGIYYCKNNECFFDKIVTSNVLNEGDLVVTSGVAGNFSSGLILGEVANINSSPEKLFKSSNVVSFLNIDQIQRVGVITNE